MKTVFLVSTGYYSDYSIRSVWSTRELADAELARMEEKKRETGYGSDDPRVEEYYLDAPEEGGESQWRVDLGYPWQAGNIARVDLEPKRGRVAEDQLNPKFRGCVYVEAETKEQAIKIAGERRQAALAKLALTGST